MENKTTVIPLRQPIVFELEGFDVPPGFGPFLFFLTLLSYLVVLLGNGVVMWVIIADKNLHRPMFVMVCHLFVCDLLGATAVLPHLMRHFLMGQKGIAYMPAIFQAFSVHMYGTAVQNVLGVMAYDRYVAVCEPLRYHAIMTSARMHAYCALAWVGALLLISSLFVLHINVPLCSQVIPHVYCSNRSILDLACIPTPESNIYGLIMTWSVSSGIFILIAFSYIKILTVSIKQGRTEKHSWTKAFQTCTPHIVTYILYELAALIIVMSYRFPSVSPNLRRFLSILFIIVPPGVNPLIYGLVSRELRSSIVKHFSFKFCTKHKQTVPVNH